MDAPARKLMWQQLKAALKRAAFAALIAAIPFLLNFVKDYEWPAEYSTYIFFLVRIGEGLYDEARNAKGDVSPEDVGAHLPPIATK